MAVDLSYLRVRPQSLNALPLIFLALLLSRWCNNNLKCEIRVEFLREARQGYFLKSSLLYTVDRYKLQQYRECSQHYSFSYAIPYLYQRILNNTCQYRSDVKQSSIKRTCRVYSCRSRGDLWLASGIIVLTTSPNYQLADTLE